MYLASLLTREQIVPSVQSTDHWEVIVELVEHLCRGGFLDGSIKADILAALKEREEKISTGIGSGVAIPHAFCDKIDKVVAVFGHSKEGVNFEAIDNNPVHFIVLFIVPQKEYHLHLRTLAAIAKLFTRCDIRSQLATAETSEDILNVFTAHSAKA